MVYTIFHKKFTATHANNFASTSINMGAGIDSKHQHLAEELHKL